jgi:hypothetical protein
MGGWVVLRADPDDVEKRKIPCPYPKSNQDSLALKPVA